MSEMYVVKTNGKYTLNQTEIPRYSDMVVTDDGSLKIEAPATGYFSTPEQRKKVNNLAGEWLRGKVTPKGGGEIVIKEATEHIADGVDVSYIVVTIEGSNALSDDEAVAGAGYIGEWVGKTGKKDAAKAPTAPVKTATPPANTGKTTPPANTGKTTPPTDTSKTTPPANTGKTTSPAKATKDTGTHWDNNLSVDENIERLWHSAG